jgi:formate dehydrogenase subunit gamma
LVVSTHSIFKQTAQRAFGEGGTNMAAETGWKPDAAQAIIEAGKSAPGALLPILHALQDAFGYIDRSAVPVIAEALNLSRAEVHGVITFYHDFRSAPPGERVLKLCRAESCQAMGCETLVAHLAAQHGIAVDATTTDGRLTVETVYCLGNCALSPAAMLDGELLGRVDAALLDDLCRLPRGSVS